MNDSPNVKICHNGESCSNTEYNVYKRRWWMLFLFCMLTFSNALLFTSLSSINDITQRYWQVDSTIINWLPNIFNLIFVFASIPGAYYLHTFGLRTSMIIAASLNAISTALHFAGFQNKGFSFIIIGQVFAALAGPLILQMPARLSTLWFPEQEHSKATSIGVFCNVIGVAISFLQPTQMVPDTENIKVVCNGMYWLFLSQSIFIGVGLILVYLSFQDKPPSPPSYASARITNPNIKFNYTLKMLVKDKNYNLVVQSFSLYFAVNVYCSILLNEMTVVKVNVKDIGWMGFGCNIGGIIGLLLAGILLDKFKCFRFLSLFTIFGALACFSLFTYGLRSSLSAKWIFYSYWIYGLFGLPYLGICCEQVSEMMYPVPESTSTAILLLVGSLYSFILVLVFGKLVHLGYTALVCYLTIGILALSLFIGWLSSTNLNRHAVEINHVLQKDIFGESCEDLEKD